MSFGFAHIHCGPVGDSAGVNQAAFDTFISNYISQYRSNMNDSLFQSPDLTLTLESELGTANISTGFTALRDYRVFTTRVSSSIDLVNRIGTMEIVYELHQIAVTGYYNLVGVASSVIIVNGNGPYSIQSNSSTWSHTANIAINSTGYATLNWNTPQHLSYDPINATFDGIVGGDVIGELIQDYLRFVGDNVFSRVRVSAGDALSVRVADYISSVLQTITVDEILNGGSPSTTIGTTTWSPPSSSSPTMRPDLVVDVGADLAGSGWIIPTTAACGYATIITGFFCDGSPIIIRDPFSGTGFWMSPCAGRCTFHYDNVVNGNTFQKLGFRAYYSVEAATGSRILVDFEHSSGTTHLEFRKSGGEYREIDFTQYGILRNINVTMENDGFDNFAVLDRLSVSFP
ncbi:uncharacterized protein LOC110848604 isoform X2 [Folsomia candida]|nr:uncharacterized protein LOC110848604 isoform X2 [Folsomia candida]